MYITKMCYQNIIVFLCIVSPTFESIVKLLPTTSFNLPINFKDGKLPCSRDTVIFPETVFTSIRLESETSVAGFILPKEGDIVLADGAVVFGADEADYNCTQEGNVYYLEKAVAKWSQPDIWSSPKFNEATPDAERVPCFDDIVEFPSAADFTLTLPDQEQSVVNIKLGNYTFTTHEAFLEYIVRFDSDQKFILNNFFRTGLTIKQETCLSKAGCPCQKNRMDINCESKHCSAPTCVDPVKPEGHCCKICGGVIVFDITESFDIMIFQELVEKTVESYGKSSLIYHIGRLPHNKVQLVVVDNAEYSGLSSQVVTAISHQMKTHWVQGAKLVDISGSPLDKSGIGGKIFVSMFFLVVLVMGGIYIYYYRFPQMSNIQFPIMRRNTAGVFSRFQTRTDSVVCLTRRDSETRIKESAGTAFRNPLYDSTRQRMEVQEAGAPGGDDIDNE